MTPPLYICRVHGYKSSDISVQDRLDLLVNYHEMMWQIIAYKYNTYSWFHMHGSDNGAFPRNYESLLRTYPRTWQSLFLMCMCIVSVKSDQSLQHPHGTSSQLSSSRLVDPCYLYVYVAVGWSLLLWCPVAAEVPVGSICHWGTYS